MSIPVVFGLIAFAGVFLLMIGVGQMRRAAGGTEDFQARLAAYGVTTAGAATLPPTTGFRDSLNRLFQPAADRVGRGNLKKGKPSVADQLQRADLRLRTSEFLMIQLGSTALFVLIAVLRFDLPLGGLIQTIVFGVIGYVLTRFSLKFR